MKGRTLKEYIKGEMKKPEFKKAWNDLTPEFALLKCMIEAREKTGISQAELAKRIGTKQPALSRLEKGGYRKATLETLEKITEALGLRLVIKIEPKRKTAA